MGRDKGCLPLSIYPLSSFNRRERECRLLFVWCLALGRRTPVFERVSTILPIRARRRILCFIVSQSTVEVLNTVSENFRPLAALVGSLHSAVETFAAVRLVALATKSANPKREPRIIVIAIIVGLRNLKAAQNVLPASRHNTQSFGKDSEVVDRNLKGHIFKARKV